MSPTEYDADIFFLKKKSYFSGVMHSGIKICIFGTQLLLLWNTTVTSLECNVLVVWRGALLQHYDCSNYNSVTVLI